MSSVKTPSSGVCLLASFVVLLVASSCSCSDSGPAAPIGTGASRVTFLEVQAVNTNPGLGPEIHRKLRIGKDNDWKLSNGARTLRPAPGAGQIEADHMLILKDFERRPVVTIPGEFDPQAFNLVAVHVIATGKFEMKLEFANAGKVLARTTPKPIGPAKTLQTLFFDVPQLPRLEGDLDEMRLDLDGIRNPLKLVGVDLLRQPDHAFLPDPATGARLVKVRGEARNAVGVAPSRPVHASIESAPDRVLRFSYAVPEDLIHPREDLSLRVTLEGAGEFHQEKSYALDAKRNKTRWRQVLIPIDVQGQVEVSWEVEGAGEGVDPVCALGEASVVKLGAENRVVLLITSDTHRGDHLGAAEGAVDVRTPMIDALAARGVLFEDCFSATNITNPSHIAMMTGVHPRDHGIVNNYTRVADAAPTLAEAFRDAGYITYAGVSTRHLSDATSGLGQGFERTSHPHLNFARSGDDTIEIVEGWINESNGMPIFVWLHLFDAHMPYEDGKSSIGEYYGDQSAAFDSSLPELEPAAVEALKSLRLENLRDLDYPRALYKAEISLLDQRLGAFLELPALSDAIIGFTGDHGESLGNHRIYFAHEELYRESLHVPMVLAWPGSPQGVSHAEGVTNRDLGRTLLDLAGLAGVEFPGRNLAQVIEDEGVEEEPRFALSAHAREVSVTLGGWHLQLRLKKNDLADGTVTRQAHQVELYYLPEDPDCSVELSEKEFARAKGMRAQALRWLDSRSELNWLGGDSGDQETMAKLEALGYTGSKTAGPMELSIDPECDCRFCEPFQ